jgi:ribosomal protein L37AE/L43A
MKKKLKGQELKDVIIKARTENPCINMADIGRKLGCTREYVRLILKEHGLQTRKPIRKHICNNCGSEYHALSSNSMFCSKKCSKEFSGIILTCTHCDKLFYRANSRVRQSLNHGSQNFYCSKVCFSDDKIMKSIKLYDDVLHELRDNKLTRYKTATKLNIQYKTVCNIINKLNIRNEIIDGRYSKLSYDEIWKTHLDTGLGCRKLGRLLHIPESTIGRILAKKRMELKKN